MSDLPEHCTVRYTNWRGETSDRRLILGAVRFGSTDWHPDPTWLINAFDLDHPAQIWKEFDLTKCDFTRADQPPALALPEVAALVGAAEKAINDAVADEMDNWFGQLKHALAQIKDI